MKYMGSKREILEFVTSSIQNLDIEANYFCDLFSGTSIIGASLRDEYNVHVNDIQQYTSVFANTYFLNLNRVVDFRELEVIKTRVLFLVEEFSTNYPDLIFNYSTINSFEELEKIERTQQDLITYKFDIGFHLFVKYYSGTYWSYDQCVWIDSIRSVSEEYRGRPEFYLIMSSLIYAMSYTSQGTGHFAQFRDVTQSNMNDIMLYRLREVWPLFEKKFTELHSIIDVETLNPYTITSLDYLDCLRLIQDNTIVYADPPYSSVHYSRFYHAIETLVKYDYPVVKYKGRYREDRHQSPFGKKTEVKNAFRSLFENIKVRNSHLILSYSDNGMITQNEIEQIGHTVFGKQYEHDIHSKGHIHSKMGRSDEHNMDVNELIITYKKK